MERRGCNRNYGGSTYRDYPFRVTVSDKPFFEVIFDVPCGTQVRIYQNFQRGLIQMEITPNPEFDVSDTARIANGKLFVSMHQESLEKFYDVLNTREMFGRKNLVKASLKPSPIGWMFLMGIGACLWFHSLMGLGIITLAVFVPTLLNTLNQSEGNND